MVVKVHHIIAPELLNHSAALLTCLLSSHWVFPPADHCVIEGGNGLSLLSMLPLPFHVSSTPKHQIDSIAAGIRPSYRRRTASLVLAGKTSPLCGPCMGSSQLRGVSPPPELHPCRCSRPPPVLPTEYSFILRSLHYPDAVLLPEYGVLEWQHYDRAFPEGPCGDEDVHPEPTRAYTVGVGLLASCVDLYGALKLYSKDACRWGWKGECDVVYHCHRANSGGSIAHHGWNVFYTLNDFLRGFDKYEYKQKKPSVRKHHKIRARGPFFIGTFFCGDVHRLSAMANFAAYRISAPLLLRGSDISCVEYALQGHQNGTRQPGRRRSYRGGTACLFCDH